MQIENTNLNAEWTYTLNVFKQHDTTLNTFHTCSPTRQAVRKVRVEDHFSTRILLSFELCFECQPRQLLRVLAQGEPGYAWGPRGSLPSRPDYWGERRGKEGQTQPPHKRLITDFPQLHLSSPRPSPHSLPSPPSAHLHPILLPIPPPPSPSQMRTRTRMYQGR